MKHLLFLILFLPLCTVALGASERANTVLVRPGEVVYARFTQKGTKLKLVSTSKEKDEGAQVILTMAPADPAKIALISLKLENKFALDLTYRMEIRMKKERLVLPATNSRAVGNKIALEQIPSFVEAVAIYAFKLEK